MEVKPGYKLTDVGEIPADWVVKTVGEISDVKTGPFGSALHEKDYVNYGTPIITVEHLGDRGVIHKNLPMVSDTDRIRLKAYSLHASDIVFSRVGSVDRNALIKYGEEGWLFSGRLLRVRLEDSNTDACFLSYHFHSEAFKQRVKDVAVGQTMASINTQILMGVKVVLPPTCAEQETIAEALSDADAFIESLEQLIAKKRQIKRGALQELLTGKRRLPEFIRKTGYKKTEVGLIPDDWDILTLGKVCTLYNGRAYALHEWETSGVPVIRLQNLTGGNEYYYSTMQLDENKYCYRGDLLYMWSATFGPCIWTGDKAIYHYHIWKVVPKDSQAIKEFLYYKLGEITEDKKVHASNGGTMLHVTKGSMESTRIAIPPLPEQTAIGIILKDIDTEIDALESKLAKARQIKQGMMQELLTGRIRLI